MDEAKEQKIYPGNGNRRSSHEKYVNTNVWMILYGDRERLVDLYGFAKGAASIYIW